MQLVLSLFPGIGLLDQAFEAEGFCVVRGPDLLWGGDVRTFHPPAGRFDGVIGGPPCQAHSRLAALVRHVHGDDAVAPDMIPDFVRVIEEARPAWFLMENVPGAPVPAPSGYEIRSSLINQRWVPDATAQNRVRRFTFGTSGPVSPSGFQVETTALEPFGYTNAVCASGTTWMIGIGGSGKPKPDSRFARHGRPEGRHSAAYLREACIAQGLPLEYLEKLTHPRRGPFTIRAAIHAIGNGVPLPLGRAVARAVKAAIGEGA